MDTTVKEESVKAEAKIDLSPSNGSMKKCLEEECKSTEVSNCKVKLSVVSGDTCDTIMVDSDKLIVIGPEKLQEMADSEADGDRGKEKPRQECDEGFDDEDEDAAESIPAEPIGSKKVVRDDKDLDSVPTDLDATPPIRSGGGQNRKAPDSDAPQVDDESFKPGIPEIITTFADSPKSISSNSESEKNETDKDDASNVKDAGTAYIESKDKKPLNVETDKVKSVSNEKVLRAMGIFAAEKSENRETFNAETDKKEGKLNVETNKKGEEVKGTSENKEVPKPLDDAKNQHNPNDTTEKEHGTWLDILGSGHLMKKVLKCGIPNTRPNKSDICILNYEGRLENGTVVEKVKNFKIQLNDNEVIQGIDFALALMDKGEKAELKITSRFAYGVLGRAPDIPSGSTLIYEIELVDVQDEPIIHKLSLEERVKYGLQKKQRGNFWYSRGDHSLAIDCYRRALEYLDDTGASEPQDVPNMQKLLEERLKTYNNLAASQLKVCAFDAALMSVNNVLNAQPRNVKALYRKTKIYREKGDIDMAMKTVRTALSYDPDLKILQQELSSLLAEDRKIFSRERELYKKMLGNNPNQEKEDEKKSSSNHYNTFKWFTIISFAVAVIGTIAFKYSK